MAINYYLGVFWYCRMRMAKVFPYIYGFQDHRPAPNALWLEITCELGYDVQIIYQHGSILMTVLLFAPQRCCR